MATAILVQVEPIKGDSYETAGYVSCDVCYQSACDDIWAGKLCESEWRQFYDLNHGEIIICSVCIDNGLLFEEEASVSNA